MHTSLCVFEGISKKKLLVEEQLREKDMPGVYTVPSYRLRTRIS